MLCSNLVLLSFFQRIAMVHQFWERVNFEQKSSLSFEPKRNGKCFEKGKTCCSIFLYHQKEEAVVWFYPANTARVPVSSIRFSCPFISCRTLLNLLELMSQGIDDIQDRFSRRRKSSLRSRSCLSIQSCNSSDSGLEHSCQLGREISQLSLNGSQLVGEETQSILKGFWSRQWSNSRDDGARAGSWFLSNKFSSDHSGSGVNDSTPLLVEFPEDTIDWLQLLSPLRECLESSISNVWVWKLRGIIAVIMKGSSDDSGSSFNHSLKLSCHFKDSPLDVGQLTSHLLNWSNGSSNETSSTITKITNTGDLRSWWVCLQSSHESRSRPEQVEKIVRLIHWEWIEGSSLVWSLHWKMTGWLLEYLLQANSEGLQMPKQPKTGSRRLSWWLDSIWYFCQTTKFERLIKCEMVWMFCCPVLLYFFLLQSAIPEKFLELSDTGVNWFDYWKLLSTLRVLYIIKCTMKWMIAVSFIPRLSTCMKSLYIFFYHCVRVFGKSFCNHQSLQEWITENKIQQQEVWVEDTWSPHFILSKIEKRRQRKYLNAL